MRNFDFFEFTSVLVPGTVSLFGLSRFFPSAWSRAFGAEFNVGEFGLFVILAYVTGQLVQVIGHHVEKLLWLPKRGLPTDSVRHKLPEPKPGKMKERGLLDPQQLKLLAVKIRETLKLVIVEDDLTKFEGNWYAITRQIYAAVRRGGLHERVDLFNAHYNMFRGMLVSFTFLLLPWGLIRFGVLGHWQPLYGPALGVILGSMVCSYLGLLGYGNLYGRELFVQFLELKPDDKKAASPTEKD